MPRGYIKTIHTCIEFKPLVMEGVTTSPSLVMLLQHQNFLARSREQSPHTQSPNTTPNDDGIQMLWDFVTFKSYKRLCFVPPKNCQLKAMTWYERIRCKTGTVITLCILKKLLYMSWVSLIAVKTFHSYHKQHSLHCLYF